MITNDFEKKKIRLTGQVLFKADITLDIEVDAYPDGIVVESIPILIDRHLLPEAHRLVSAGISQARIVNAGVSFIEESKTSRDRTKATQVVR